MGTRLNYHSRRQIVYNAIHGQFEPLRKALFEEENAMAERIYKTLVPLKHRKVLEEMVKLGLPYTAGYDTSRIVCIASGGETLGFCCKPPVIAAPSNMARFRLHEHPDLDKSAIALKRKGMALEQRRNDAIKALTDLLNRVSTLEKLFEQWPEGKKYYQSPPLAKPIALPAVRFEQVNKMLGLA